MCVCERLLKTLPFRSADAETTVGAAGEQVRRSTTHTHFTVCDSSGPSESAAFNQSGSFSWILYPTSDWGGCVEAFTLHACGSTAACVFVGVCVLFLFAVCSTNEARMLSESLMSR